MIGSPSGSTIEAPKPGDSEPGGYRPSNGSTGFCQPPPFKTQLGQLCLALALAAFDLVLLPDPYDRMFSYEPNWRGDTISRP